MLPVWKLRILDVHPNATVRLIEGGGGVFDVIVDGKTLYSKRNEPRRVSQSLGLSMSIANAFRISRFEIGATVKQSFNRLCSSVLGDNTQ